MLKEEKTPETSVEAAPPKRTWVAPALEELPRLTDLTLDSFIPGSGSIRNGVGSTVF